jgi:hypothetical protein
MTPLETTTGGRTPFCEEYDGDGRCMDPGKICLGRGLGDACLYPRIHSPAPEKRGDALNDILVECAKLRGCYPLMHRTLRQFDWFCSAVIFGGDFVLKHDIRKAEAAGDDSIARGLRALWDEENGLKARFNERYYQYDGLELVRLAEAFRIYCKEQYGPIQVFSRDFDDAPRSGATKEGLQ